VLFVAKLRIMNQALYAFSPRFLWTTVRKGVPKQWQAPGELEDKPDS
jgi:hypothetical protein